MCAFTSFLTVTLTLPAALMTREVSIAAIFAKRMMDGLFKPESFKSNVMSSGQVWFSALVIIATHRMPFLLLNVLPDVTRAGRRFSANWST